LLTIEGENDDISGVGQTEAAHRICVNIPSDRKAHWLQPAVGHYGVFNGSRFRAEIVPRISDFVLSNNTNSPRKVRRPASSTQIGAATAGNGSAQAQRSAEPCTVPD
jgi:poly(3-hydroxybutyrate) depolymerase